MSHERIQCQHGYVLSQCRCMGERVVKLIACRNVPACPAYGPAEFTDEDLRMIMAMCATANPQFPDQDMYPAWQGLYLRAQGRLLDRASRARETPRGHCAEVPGFCICDESQEEN
jgi:hypothetical protein